MTEASQHNQSSIFGVLRQSTGPASAEASLRKHDSNARDSVAHPFHRMRSIPVLDGWEPSGSEVVHSVAWPGVAIVTATHSRIGVIEKHDVGAVKSEIRAADRARIAQSDGQAVRCTPVGCGPKFDNCIAEIHVICAEDISSRKMKNNG